MQGLFLCCCLKNKPAVFNQKLIYTAVLFNNVNHAFSTEAVTCFFGHWNSQMELRLFMKAVADINAEFIVF